MRKRVIIILSILAIIAIILGIILIKKNQELLHDKIEILDATYASCLAPAEQFYEDDKYIYYFPCVKSNSVYVKFPNGNKLLVTKALEEEKVTIDELMDVGLDAIKNEK